MTFLIQFLRLRRGVLEVVHTIHVAAADGSAALARVQRLVGPGSWPMRTAALRVLDDRGRKLIDWMVPVAAAPPHQSLPNGPLRERIYNEPRPAPSRGSEDPPDLHALVAPPTRRHLFDVGQPVSYAEDGKPDIWKGGYEIVSLLGEAGEPRYVIRNADLSYDRIVQEHELGEDLGARVRGR